MTPQPDPLHSLEEQIITVEARLDRRRQREALLSAAGRQWVIDNVEAPIEALRARIREREGR